MLLLAVGCSKVIPADQVLEADELVARDPATLSDTPLRVHGFVKRGTIASRTGGGRSFLTFLVTNHDKSFPVIYAGQPPDKFQDQAEVIVRGTIQPGSVIDTAPSQPYVLEATQILAKCPTNYDRGTGEMPAKYQ